MRKITKEEFLKRCKKIHGDNYIHLDEYKNMITKMHFRCKNINHKIFYQRAQAHMLGNGCAECSGNNKKSINYLKLLANKKNGKCLSKVYKNSKTKYEWKCVSGHTWLSSMNDVNCGNWCPKCSIEIIKNKLRKKNGKEYIDNLAIKNNGICVTKTYDGMVSKYMWKCEKNHNWLAKASDIQQGKWCPYCRESKGEKLIEKNLLKYNIKYIRQYKFKDCKLIKPLPFDFYLPDFNCCIEFDGRQHFEQSTGSWKNIDLNKIKFRDEIKNIYCSKNNIRLIRIPYFKIMNINEIILELIKN